MWLSKICKSAFLFVLFLLASNTAKGDFVEELSRAIFQLIDLQKKKTLEGTPDSSYVYKTKTDGHGITQDMGVYFSASAVREADMVLKQLDTSGKKTVIFIVRHWFDYNKKGGKSKNLQDFNKELAGKLQKVRKLAQDKLNMSQANVNILLCLHMMVQEPLTRAQTSQSSKYTWDLYKDELLLNYGLNDSCAREVHKTINRAMRDKGSAYRFSKNKDEALKFRAKVLWEELEGCGKSTINLTPLTENNFKSAARKMGVEVAAIKAFAEVEAKGSGFLPSKRLKILFEGHYFYKYLKEFGLNPLSLKVGNKDIIYTYEELENMSPKPYKGGEREYERLDKAKLIHAEAAMLSASYGMFQIMGDNYKTCGYNSVFDFVKALSSSYERQLDAFVKFCMGKGIQHDLNNKDWDEAARKYNGPAYEKNKYDVKLEEAYEKYSE